MSTKIIPTMLLMALLGLTAAPTGSAFSCGPVDAEFRLFEVRDCPDAPEAPGVPVPPLPDQDDLRQACDDANYYVWYVDHQFPQFALRGLPCHYL